MDKREKDSIIIQTYFMTKLDSKKIYISTISRMNHLMNYI